MIIVRLLSPGPWLVGTTKVYSGVGADIVMESITLTTDHSVPLGQSGSSQWCLVAGDSFPLKGGNSLKINVPQLVEHRAAGVEQLESNVAVLSPSLQEQ